MMIKPDEFRTLVDYYKGKISESTLLDKAARVAAEAQILIDDPNTPAALKEPVVKEMLKEKNMLNDKLRQGPSVAMTAPGVPQPPVDDDKMDGLQERLLKELVKSINANTQSIVPQITQTPLTVKKEEPKPKKKRKQTEVEPSWLILTQVSRKGILPSFSCSEVNWMCWSMEFRCSEKESPAFS